MNTTDYNALFEGTCAALGLKTSEERDVLERFSIRVWDAGLEAASIAALRKENQSLRELLKRYEENFVTDQEEVGIRPPLDGEQRTGAGVGDVPESVGISTGRKSKPDDLSICIAPLISKRDPDTGETGDFHQEVFFRVNVRQAYNLFLALREVLVVPWYEDAKRFREFLFLTLPANLMTVLGEELDRRGIRLEDAWDGRTLAVTEVRVQDAVTSTVVRLRALLDGAKRG